MFPILSVVVLFFPFLFISKRMRVAPDSPTKQDPRALSQVKTAVQREPSTENITDSRCQEKVTKPAVTSKKKRSKCYLFSKEM